MNTGEKRNSTAWDLELFSSEPTPPMPLDSQMISGKSRDFRASRLLICKMRKSQKKNSNNRNLDHFSSLHLNPLPLKASHFPTLYLDLENPSRLLCYFTFTFSNRYSLITLTSFLFFDYTKLFLSLGLHSYCFLCLKRSSCHSGLSPNVTSLT